MDSDPAATIMNPDAGDVRRMLDLLGEIEPAGEPVRLRSNFQNGIESLPVRW